MNKMNLCEICEQGISPGDDIYYLVPAVLVDRDRFEISNTSNRMMHMSCLQSDLIPEEIVHGDILDFIGANE
jgi:hypothetical protein